MSQENIVLFVEGMTCSNCERIVEQVALDAGADDAEADFINKQLSVDFDPSYVTIDVIKNAIENNGYDIEV